MNRAIEEPQLHPRAVPRRRQEFRLGRAAAHLALDQLGFGPLPVPRGDHREPIWPPGVVGSITHSAGRAMVAVARRADSGGIGLDLEARHEFPELAEHVAFDVEVEWLATVPDDRRADATLELFSAKESVFKAFWPRNGRYFGFEAARLTPASPDSYTARLIEAVDPAYPPDRTFDVHLQWRGDLVLTWVLLEPGD